LKSRFPDAIYYDFLKQDLFFRFSKAPHLFREEILSLPHDAFAYPIILDEIQKIPALLDEVHWLIENTSAAFVLCGSSARKLKRGAANLLGGRAWRYAFFSLVYPEVPDYDLLRVFTHGLIPNHYLSSQPLKSINAYIQDYLKEEIQAEGLVRNLPAFSRFLDSLRFCHGELLNYANIARDCGVDAKTVKEYFQILVDTLIGYTLEPFVTRGGRQIISATPKFYLFDVGVANRLCKRKIGDLKGEDAGRSLEHLILLELVGFRGLQDMDFDIRFWRTKTGLEVDFILGDSEVAIEVKISTSVSRKDLRGLLAFHDEFPSAKLIVISQDERPRKIIIQNGHIDVLPWRVFLERLWKMKII
jgi:predicted AAA+ superfamily ATPase